jgi:hypothetical protein
VDYIGDQMDDKAAAIVRPRLAELKGYLSSVPDSTLIYGWELAQSLDKVIDELSAATGWDYSRFRVTQQERQIFGAVIDATEYRAKLTALVNRLHEELTPAE